MVHLEVLGANRTRGFVRRFRLSSVGTMLRGVVRGHCLL